MTTIPATNTDPTPLSGNKTSITEKTAPTPPAAVKDETATDGVSDQDSIKISSRSQNIQKLNEEFFSNGVQSFKVTPDFIQRLNEYNLISDDEADQLNTQSKTINPDSAPSGGAETVGELSVFVDSFVGTVKEFEPGNSIISTLQQAQSVLDNFNQPTESSARINIPQVVKQLQNYIHSSTEKLPDSDKHSFNQLVLALDTANKLTPGTSTTSEINSYLAIKKL